MSSSFNGKWVLLVMDDPQLRRLYVRLLERRNHRVLYTADTDEATRLIQSKQLDLAVIDDDLDGHCIDDWLQLHDAPPLVVLQTPSSPQDAGSSALNADFRCDVDLIIQKPMSPMEFGIQVDHLLGDTDESTLQEDSEADREFEALQREFVYQLDEDLGWLDDHWSEVVNGADSPQRPASRLRRQLSPLCTASRHYGFIDLADDFRDFKTFVETLMAPGHQLDKKQQRKGRAILDSLHSSCRELQAHHSSIISEPHSEKRQNTLLIVDPDPDYLQSIEEFGDQFMLRVRTARNLDDARRRVRTPLLTGVLLSISATSTTSSLQSAVDELRDSSSLHSLPVALVGDDGQALDRVRSLWAGASVLLSKPVTTSKFARAARRLASLRRAQQASILVVEPDEDFAHFLQSELDSRHMAVHCHDTPSSLFGSLEDHRPDLVIIDAHVPVVSSFDVCRALRAIPRWQDTPIIMVADNPQPELRLAAYEAGADDFFGRDITTEELQARVHLRLDRAKMLRERTDRDSLTGLLTRRAFLERLAGRLSEVTRHGRSLVFAILDIDHFKAINDHHGHPAGDRVLKVLGRLLRDRFRIEDLRARWGGEEFTIVLVDEELQTARKALDRVRTEFSDIEFEGESGASFEVSFSAGIAVFPEDGHDAETLLSAADSRLLRAKRAGRNRIAIGQS